MSVLLSWLFVTLLSLCQMESMVEFPWKCSGVGL